MPQATENWKIFVAYPRCWQCDASTCCYIFRSIKITYHLFKMMHIQDKTFKMMHPIMYTSWTCKTTKKKRKKKGSPTTQFSCASAWEYQFLSTEGIRNLQKSTLIKYLTITFMSSDSNILSDINSSYSMHVEALLNHPNIFTFTN